MAMNGDGDDEDVHAWEHIIRDARGSVSCAISFLSPPE